MKYYIQEYYSGLDIVTKNGYTRYFKNLSDAEDFLALLTDDGYNDEDNFYVVAENEDGENTPIFY